MKTAIAVFCKTPGFSPIKTRLGAEIGKDYAEEFYLLSVNAIAEVLGEVIKRLGSHVEAYWAVAEQEALTHSLWSSYARIWTGDGSLGDRIHNVFEQLFKEKDQVIIIGSDSPQITADYLITTIERLQQPDLQGVIGPCRDGGFVLFGCKHLIQKSIWTKVTYSRKNTLQQLITLLDESDYLYHFNSTLGDVDQYNDLILLQDDFLKMGSKIKSKQLHLYRWIKTVKVFNSIRILETVC